MILALEGPDRSGKTTVFEELKKRVDATFVPSLSMPEGVPPGLLVSKLAQLWELLYRDNELYVCDRSLFVSGPVYAAVFGSEFPYEWIKWKDRVRVAYFDASDSLLEARCRATGEPLGLRQLYRIRENYSLVLPYFQHIKLDGSKPTDELVDGVLQWL